jgi:hypothetical protein
MDKVVKRTGSVNKRVIFKKKDEILRRLSEAMGKREAILRRK